MSTKTSSVQLSGAQSNLRTIQQAKRALLGNVYMKTSRSKFNKTQSFAFQTARTTSNHMTTTFQSQQNPMNSTQTSIASMAIAQQGILQEWDGKNRTMGQLHPHLDYCQTNRDKIVSQKGLHQTHFSCTNSQDIQSGVEILGHNIKLEIKTNKAVSSTVGEQSGLYPAHELTPIINYNSNSSITDLTAVIGKETMPARIDQADLAYDAEQKEQQMQTDLDGMYQSHNMNSGASQQETIIKYGTTLPLKHRPSKRPPHHPLTNNTNMIYFDRTQPSSHTAHARTQESAATTDQQHVLSKLNMQLDEELMGGSCQFKERKMTQAQVLRTGTSPVGGGCLPQIEKVGFEKRNKHGSNVNNHTAIRVENEKRDSDTEEMAYSPDFEGNRNLMDKQSVNTQSVLTGRQSGNKISPTTSKISFARRSTFNQRSNMTNHQKSEKKKDINTHTATVKNIKNLHAAQQKMTLGQTYVNNQPVSNFLPTDLPTKVHQTLEHSRVESKINIDTSSLESQDYPTHHTTQMAAKADKTFEMLHIKSSEVGFATQTNFSVEKEEMKGIDGVKILEKRKSTVEPKWDSNGLNDSIKATENIVSHRQSKFSVQNQYRAAQRNKNIASIRNVTLKPESNNEMFLSHQQSCNQASQRGSSILLQNQRILNNPSEVQYPAGMFKINDQADFDSKCTLKGSFRGSKRVATDGFNALETARLVYPIIVEKNQQEGIAEWQKGPTQMYEEKLSNFGRRKATLDQQYSRTSDGFMVIDAKGAVKRKVSVQEQKGKAIADRFRNQSLHLTQILVQMGSGNLKVAEKPSPDIDATVPSSQFMSRNPTLKVDFGQQLAQTYSQDSKNNQVSGNDVSIPGTRGFSVSKNEISLLQAIRDETNSMTDALMQHSNPDSATVATAPNLTTIQQVEIRNRQKDSDLFPPPQLVSGDNSQCCRALDKSIKFKNRQPQPYSNFVNVPILPPLRRGYISPRYINASRSGSSSPAKGKVSPLKHSTCENVKVEKGVGGSPTQMSQMLQQSKKSTLSTMQQQQHMAARVNTQGTDDQTIMRTTRFENSGLELEMHNSTLTSQMHSISGTPQDINIAKSCQMSRNSEEEIEQQKQAEKEAMYSLNMKSKQSEQSFQQTKLEHIEKKSSNNTQKNCMNIQSTLTKVASKEFTFESLPAQKAVIRKNVGTGCLVEDVLQKKKKNVQKQQTKINKITTKLEGEDIDKILSFSPHKGLLQKLKSPDCKYKGAGAGMYKSPENKSPQHLYQGPQPMVHATYNDDLDSLQARKNSRQMFKEVLKSVESVKSQFHQAALSIAGTNALSNTEVIQNVQNAISSRTNLKKAQQQQMRPLPISQTRHNMHITPNNSWLQMKAGGIGTQTQHENFTNSSLSETECLGRENTQLIDTYDNQRDVETTSPTFGEEAIMPLSVHKISFDQVVKTDQGNLIKLAEYKNHHSPHGKSTISSQFNVLETPMQPRILLNFNQPSGMTKTVMDSEEQTETERRDSSRKDVFRLNANNSQVVSLKEGSTTNVMGQEQNNGNIKRPSQAMIPIASLEVASQITEQLEES